MYNSRFLKEVYSEQYTSLIYVKLSLEVVIVEPLAGLFNRSNFYKLLARRPRFGRLEVPIDLPPIVFDEFGEVTLFSHFFEPSLFVLFVYRMTFAEFDHLNGILYESPHAVTFFNFKRRAITDNNTASPHLILIHATGNETSFDEFGLDISDFLFDINRVSLAVFLEDLDGLDVRVEPRVDESDCGLHDLCFLYELLVSCVFL
nr:MAG TPA: hypothetical protein [Caudoviricetes sp.]